MSIDKQSAHLKLSGKELKARLAEIKKIYAQVRPGEERGIHYNVTHNGVVVLNPLALSKRYDDDLKLLDSGIKKQ